MENPFETIMVKLNSIERMLIELSKNKELEKRRIADENEFFSINEIANYLKLARATVYKMTCDRKIPYYKRNGKLYFVKKEIFDWLTEGRRVTIDEYAIQKEEEMIRRRRR